MSTSLREGLDCIRLAEHYNKRIHINSNCVESTGAILLIKTGEQCTIAGDGEIFQKFMQCGNLQEYGCNDQHPVSFYDENFETATFRNDEFDEL